MLNLVKRSLNFMTRRERIKYFLFLMLKSLVGLLDLFAIMAIGLLSSSIVTTLRTGGNPKPVELGPLTLPGIDSRSIPALGLFILFLFILKALISILLTHKLAHSLARIEARAAKRIATNVFGDGLDGVTRYSKNEILYIVQIGSPSAFNTLLNAVGTLSTEGFLFVLVIGTFTAISPWAALGALLYFGAIGFLIQHYIGRRVQQTSQIITESSIKSSSGILDLSEVIREVSTLQKKAFFLDRIYEARIASARNMATQLVLQGTPRHIVETALIVGIATFIFLQSLSGDLSEAAVTIGVFLAGGLRLTAALLPLQGALLSINRCQPAAELALKVLEDSTVETPEDLQPSDQTDSARAVEIRIEGLNFSYTGDDNVIENVFMKIPAGSQAAFIGPSGAGKSTLADLILGLLRPSSGEVFIDDLDIVEWIDKNPGSVGYVPQKPGMVSGTIRENIALGLPQKDVDTQKLNKAISDAHLTALIDSLPEGIETDVGKHKDELSGGQIQRIGLARALYSEPSLLIMDEATSALDAESENEINKALTRMRGKVTVILIAHRLNTVQRSDVVFLIEQGNVTASGTFPELLKSNSTVRKLAALMAIASPDQSKPSE